MKKRIFLLAAVCMATLSLSACDLFPKPKDDEFEALNRMLAANYSEIRLTVTDTFDEDLFLKSEYTISYVDGPAVSYKVERFTELDAASGTLPAETKNVLSGKATIKDGVVSVEGDDVGLTARALDRNFDFKEKYFGNIRLSGVYLYADVKTPSAFLGREIVCTDMKLSATFLEVFYEIEIEYTSESGSAVNCRYQFSL